MLEQITLRAEGFSFSFDNQYNQEQEWMGTYVTFQLLPPLQELTVRSRKALLRLEDLHRLVEYFEQHMTKLRKDEDTQSNVFITWDLDFQLQALEGMVEFPGQEFFSLSCMVNAGRSENKTRVFVGGESRVTFQQVEVFLNELRAFFVERGEK